MKPEPKPYLWTEGVLDPSCEVMSSPARLAVLLEARRSARYAPFSAALEAVRALVRKGPVLVFVLAAAAGCARYEKPDPEKVALLRLEVKDSFRAARAPGDRSIADLTSLSKHERVAVALLDDVEHGTDTAPAVKAANTSRSP